MCSKRKESIRDKLSISILTLGRLEFQWCISKKHGRPEINCIIRVRGHVIPLAYRDNIIVFWEEDKSADVIFSEANSELHNYGIFNYRLNFEEVIWNQNMVVFERPSGMVKCKLQFVAVSHACKRNTSGVAH